MIITNLKMHEVAALQAETVTEPTATWYDDASFRKTFSSLPSKTYSGYI
ncbi:MAG: hypothetical protein WDO19_26430 [Bacteroidota bacterium]